MARSSTFDKRDLAWECSQVKRKILNDALKGRLISLSKSNVFEMIAQRPRIGLKSALMLWAGPHRDYLDEWFAKVNDEVNTILQSNSCENITMDNPEELAKQHQELLARVAHLTQLVTTYKKAIDLLREENTRYRLIVSQRFGKIDDLLN
ncbi:hypothetical protein [uncultured Brevibacillus sp.]|uniref:hypothetical protein n=1 Tax=uncultured Brevibacillus sp. TaxID=169970 RepID=UPI0025992F90|nr:hypothetical protein [uncultured Brevibacillus sp.]